VDFALHSNMSNMLSLKLSLLLSCAVIGGLYAYLCVDDYAFRIYVRDSDVHCNASSAANDLIVINDSDSFIQHLSIKNYSKSACIFYREHDKVRGCDTINIHQHLMGQSAQRMDQETIKEEEDRFTILINTWRRDVCLLELVEHYLHCPSVAQIRVIWSDPDHDVPDRLRTIQQNVSSDRLAFDEYRNDKLTNRFKWNPEWRTKALFQTDDDIKFSCNLLTNTFNLWRLAPDHMVGFRPRMPSLDYRIAGQQSTTRHFYLWDQAYKDCRYQMMFQTLGGFVHRKYYALYTLDDLNRSTTAGHPELASDWRQIKHSVDGNVTAEDISLSVLYSFYSGQPPIAVAAPLPDYQQMSCSAEHSQKMHDHSEAKRTNIFLDTLTALGFYANHSDFKELPSSMLFVDVMPLGDDHTKKCSKS